MKYPKHFYTSARKKSDAKLVKRKGDAPTSAIVATPPDQASFCDRIADGVDRYIERKCKTKFHQMTPINGAGDCPCSDDRGNKPAGKLCHSLKLPVIEPCISISWGDSAQDCIEGDDHEEICITICNCYENITFSNVKIAGIVVTDENGRLPPRLPDGSPSTELYPVGPYCFGDIGPCKAGEKNCISRNAMIINRGLPPGNWKVRIVGLCFDVCHHYDEVVQEFSFEVCKN